jgi:hypothetical protein
MQTRDAIKRTLINLPQNAAHYAKNMPSHALSAAEWAGPKLNRGLAATERAFINPVQSGSEAWKKTKEMGGQAVDWGKDKWQAGKEKLSPSNIGPAQPKPTPKAPKTTQPLAHGIQIHPDTSKQIDALAAKRVQASKGPYKAPTWRQRGVGGIGGALTGTMLQYILNKSQPPRPVGPVIR